MATSKHRNLTVDTLTVTGSFTGPAPVEAPTAAPVAPYPLPLPEKTTNAALRDRVEYLTSVLVEAGIIAEAVERPVSPSNAPEAPAPAQAVTAGVVDGA